MSEEAFGGRRSSARLLRWGRLHQLLLPSPTISRLKPVPFPSLSQSSSAGPELESRWEHVGWSALPASPSRAQGHRGVLGGVDPCWERGRGLLPWPSPHLGYRVTRTEVPWFPCAQAPAEWRCPPVPSRAAVRKGKSAFATCGTRSFPNPWENFGSWLSSLQGRRRRQQGCKSR